MRRTALFFAAPFYVLAQTAPDAQSGAGNIEIKTVPARQYLVHRQAVKSLDETGPIEWTVAPRMKKTLKAQGYDPVPPIEVHVLFEGPDIQDLEAARYRARVFKVAAPIDKSSGEPGPFTTEQSADFRCLSLVFKGSPLDSTRYWASLYTELKTRKLVASGENRQVAVSRDGYDSSRYVTELQLGIK